MELNEKQRKQILSAVRKRVIGNHFNVAGVNYGDWLKSFDERSRELVNADVGAFEAGVQDF